MLPSALFASAQTGRVIVRIPYIPGGNFKSQSCSSKGNNTIWAYRQRERSLAQLAQGRTRIIGGSRTIAMWQGRAGNGVRPSLLSVRSLYVPYCFPAVLILMQTQKLERPREQYRFVYTHRPSTPTLLRLGRDSTIYIIHSLSFSYSYQYTLEKLYAADIPQTWTLSTDIPRRSETG